MLKTRKVIELPNPIFGLNFRCNIDYYTALDLLTILSSISN